MMLKTIIRYITMTILNIPIGAVLDKYLRLSEFSINFIEKIINMDSLSSSILTLIIIIWHAIIITFIFEKIGISQWLQNKLRFLKNKTILPTQNDTAILIENLVSNLSSYESLYTYYTMDYKPNKQYTINIIPYVDDVLLNLELSCNIQKIVDFTVYDKETLFAIKNFYVKSKAHFDKLDSLKNYINNPDYSNYKALNIPHNKTPVDIQNGSNTIDRAKDFPIYMDDYIAKTKELADHVRELINILHSKYIDSLNPKHPINSHTESDVVI